MKKTLYLLISTLFISLITVRIPTQAMLFNTYGGATVDDSFEYTAKVITTFPYVTRRNGEIIKTLTSYSTDEAHSGRYCVKLDLSEQQSGDTLDFGRSFALDKTDPSKEWYYLSFYIKGNTINESNIDLFYAHIYSNKKTAPYSERGIEPPDKNGWRKVWFILTPLQSYDNNEALYLGINYTTGNEDTSSLYIDDYTLIPIPASITLQDRSIISGGSYDLSGITAYGSGYRKNRERIVNTDLIKWRVMEGDAQIKDNKLLFHPGAGQKFILEGNFFERKGLVSLTTVDAVPAIEELNANLSHGVVTKDHNIYRVNVTNSGALPGTAVLLVAIYDDENRLCNVYAYSDQVNPSQTVTISSAAVMPPSYLKNPIIRTYVWTSLFNGTPV